MSLAEFLVRCADRLGSEPVGLSVRERVFVDAGLAALDEFDRRPRWVQVDLPTSGVPSPDLYRTLAETFRDLLADPAVRNAFFMHKPPGLRLRFEVSDPDRATEVRRRLAGLAGGTGPAVYEPEAHLFGGPVSMRSVHRLFTVDSLAWLDYHAIGGRAAGPSWALSLTMLRALLDGLAVVGWEDIGVWDEVRSRTGRRLTGPALTHGDYARVAAEIRAGWADPERLAGQLAPEVRAISAAHRTATLAAASDWRRDYFTTPAAYLGPRAAAAYFVVFHWNRAGLTGIRQALLTEALADRLLTGMPVAR
jgi:thiopeptide-type bacteriocin biosynthesis protein